jgi:hypothetical protein
MKYVVGDSSNGAFEKLGASTESEARIEAALYGDILDKIEYLDDDGNLTVMFIVS